MGKSPRSGRVLRGAVRTRIGAWLRVQMERRDMNQMALAGRSRVSQVYISGILNYGRLPVDDYVRRLADAVGADHLEPLCAVYLDRIEKLLAGAPREMRARFRRLLE